MPSLIGPGPSQVPRNSDLGRLATRSHLGFEDIGASIPTLASAATITPTLKVCCVSGVTAIATITPPADFLNGGQVTLIPTGLWSTATTGNIALATAGVLHKALILTYDAVSAKWYPSY
jgi:hypothetical protein